jgi:hypothetical protein
MLESQSNIAQPDVGTLLFVAERHEAKGNSENFFHNVCVKNHCVFPSNHFTRPI